MPPDDTVFEGKPNGSGDEKPAEAAGTTQTTVAPTGVTQEQLDAKFSPIEKSLSEMNNFFTKLQEQATAGTQTPAAPAEGKDWATEFYEKPQETVQAEIASQAAPILQQNATFSAKVLMDEQHKIIDNQFGAGTWEAEFEPVLGPIVADAIKNYPMSLSSPTAVKNAVDTVKGDKFNALSSRANKLSEEAAAPNKELVETVADQVAQQLQGQQMIGGMRRTPNANEEKLDDEDSQEFLKEFFRQTGDQLDPKRMSKLMNTGPYLTDWEKATKEDK